MKFCRLKVLPIQFFPVALSVIFLLVYAKCNFASVLRFPNGIKILPIGPVFSSGVHVIKKVPIINCSRSSKSLKGIYFFFEI